MNKKVRLGQTYSMVRPVVGQQKGVGILVTGGGLSGNMGLMETSGFGYASLCMGREKVRVVFWFWDREHNSQTFQKVPQGGQLLGLLLHIFL